MRVSFTQTPLLNTRRVIFITHATFLSVSFIFGQNKKIKIQIDKNGDTNKN